MRLPNVDAFLLHLHETAETAEARLLKQVEEIHEITERLEREAKLREPQKRQAELFELSSSHGLALRLEKLQQENRRSQGQACIRLFAFLVACAIAVIEFPARQKALKALRKAMAYVIELINVLLRLLLSLKPLPDIVVAQRPWFLQHGARPPKLPAAMPACF